MIKLIAICTAILCAAIPAHAELNIQEVTSKGGIKAWLLNEPSIPMISMNIGFKGASTTETDDKLGATYLMAGLLEEGAGDMDAIAFKRAAEGLATSFGFDSSRERITITAEFLSKNRDASVALLKTAITEPAFNDVAFERTKSQVLSIIARNQSDPDEIASTTFNALAFAGHPYGRPYRGTTETITALTQDDMRTAHARTMAKAVAISADEVAQEMGRESVGERSMNRYDDLLRGEEPATIETDTSWLYWLMSWTRPNI